MDRGAEPELKKPPSQRSIQEWSKRERLTFAAVAFVFAGTIWATKFAPQSVHAYLDRFGPYAALLLAVVGAGASGWIHSNAPHTPEDQCPYKVGDAVYYYPSDRGRAYGALSIKTPKIGQKIVISNIVDDAYLKWDAKDAGEGIHWTEFSPEP